MTTPRPGGPPAGSWGDPPPGSPGGPPPGSAGGPPPWAPPAGPSAGWGPPPWAPPPPPPSRRRTGRIVLVVLAAIVALAAVVVVLLAFLVGPRFARYDVLDARAVEQGVTRVVTDDWRRAITDVRCPEGQRTRPGVTFTCTATVDGRPQQVPVSVDDTVGSYEVGQPR